MILVIHIAVWTHIFQYGYVHTTPYNHTKIDHKGMKLVKTLVKTLKNHVPYHNI